VLRQAVDKDRCGGDLLWMTACGSWMTTLWRRLQLFLGSDQAMSAGHKKIGPRF
jgi:hypothetical protein